MKRIPLTQGQFALVDNEDFERLNRFKWYARWSKYTKSFYAMRNSATVDGSRSSVLLHREITGAKPSEQVDHKNHDTLDNRIENLRLCSISQNQANRRIDSDSSSGHKGVSWHRRIGKFQARLGVLGKREHIGYFDSAEDAARAYAVRASQRFGEFAVDEHQIDACGIAIACALGKGTRA
jgi:hypothetical protein